MGERVAGDLSRAAGRSRGQPPAFDAAWHAYRQQTFHALAFWVFAQFVNDVSVVHPIDVTTKLVARGQAVVDLDSFEPSGCSAGQHRAPYWATPRYPSHLRYPRCRSEADDSSRLQLLWPGSRRRHIVSQWPLQSRAATVIVLGITVAGSAATDCCYAARMWVGSIFVLGVVNEEACCRRSCTGAGAFRAGHPRSLHLDGGDVSDDLQSHHPPPRPPPTRGLDIGFWSGILNGPRPVAQL